MSYNSLPKDIRMNYISLEEAKKWIRQQEKHWIYIKFNNCTFSDKGCSSSSSVYTKFKISSIDTCCDDILIYGTDDEDRLMLATENIIQTESTSDNEEIKILIYRLRGNIEIFLKKYSPNLEDRFLELKNNDKNLIITEGKTDWKHLKSAINKFKAQGEYLDLPVEFFEYEEEIGMGNATLKKLCDSISVFENKSLKIFIFDSDDESINKNYIAKDYINHGNNIYSMILPIPKHRKETPLISTENLYEDDDIKKIDKNNRRLYLANEFNLETGQHRINTNIYTPISHNIEPNHIIDDKVFTIEKNLDHKSEIMLEKNKINIALAKNDFAQNILNSISPFDNMNIDSFKLVFDVISDIYEEYIKNKSIYRNLIEVCEGIDLEKHNNGFQDLHINISMNIKQANKVKNAENLAYELFLSDTKDNINLNVFDFQSKIILYSIQIEVNELSKGFFMSKIKNNSNRIYVNIFDENMNHISLKEILNSDCSSLVIGRALNQL